MNNLATLHDDLMRRWKARLTEQAEKNHVYFNKDGIVDLDKWHAAPVKVMVLNRETNGIGTDLYIDGTYDIVDAIQRSSKGKTGWTRGNTLRVSGQWAYGLLNHDNHHYPEHKEAKKHAFTAPLAIAYVNLRKTNGGAVANLKVLHQDAERYADLIKEQLTIINPDVVICGRTLGILRERVYGDEMVKLDERTYQVGNTAFFAHWHPSARKKHNEMYSRLMEDYARYKSMV